MYKRTSKTQKSESKSSFKKHHFQGEAELANSDYPN